MNWLKTSLTLLALSVFISASPDQTPTPHIRWMSLEKAQEQMATAPKKIFVDLYTDWCGWCKVMDQKSFRHPVIVELMNRYFYAVKFNAEKEDSLVFQGESFKLMQRQGRKPLHRWARKFGKTDQGLSYPTTVYFNEALQHLQTVPGYLEPHTMEKVLEFFGNNYAQRGISWPEFEKQYESRIPPEPKKGKVGH